ncbi:MAG: hybrid sensor histidine kinase/response regulator [Desulfobaccales bacterium]
MTSKDEEFLKRLLATFRVEAEEHLQAISAGLLQLEKETDPEQRAAIVQNVFREAHSLKGAARSVSLGEVEAVCQALEGLFARWKSPEMAASPEEFDALYQALDLLAGLAEAGVSGSATVDPVQVQTTIQRLRRAALGQPSPIPEPPPLEKELAPPASEPQVSPRPAAAEPAPAESVRVPLAKLEELLQQSEEFLAARLAAGQILTEVHEVEADLRNWGAEWAKIQTLIRAWPGSLESAAAPGLESSRGLRLQQVFDFLHWSESQHKSLEARVTHLAQSAKQGYWLLSRLVEAITADLKKVLMLPLQPALEILPRLVRDLARASGKEAELLIRGGEIEIDRRVLDELKDPLIHLVRNCIDHGIEKPGERQQRGKPRRGRITVAIASLEGGKVEIRVTDDGAGIDLAKVRQAAVKIGLQTPEEAGAVEESEIWPLIFEAGLSTSPIITDISGRGLGLAILREKAEKLGGVYTVKSKYGVGTTFSLVIPITMATFRGTLVRLGSHKYVVPTRNVEQVRRVPREKIRTVENRETIELDGRALALVSLGGVLELPEDARTASGFLPVLVLVSAERRIAFWVDEVLYEQEVLEKPLGGQLSRVRNVSGVTILGTGELAPILNVADLFQSAVRVSLAGRRPAPAALEELEPAAILVAEDSITARTLLKNILEGAGYRVATAVDGLDAFGKLKEGGFDLVVSDVDMPRMNGFDLTERIRRDRGLAELPVVLVTALESPEDRERGVEAGANAYIVKSSFDQSNLLETIKRII